MPQEPVGAASDRRHVFKVEQSRRPIGPEGQKHPGASELQQYESRKETRLYRRRCIDTDSHCKKPGRMDGHQQRIVTRADFDRTACLQGFRIVRRIDELSETLQADQTENDVGPSQWTFTI